MLQTPPMSPETAKLREEKFPFHLTCAIASVFGQSVSHSEKAFSVLVPPSPSQSNRNEKSLKEITVLRNAVSRYSQIKLIKTKLKL